MVTKQKWIIDSDPGFDDFMAILYLLNKPNTEVLMISTSDGNVSIHKTTQNAKKIVKLSGKNLPIYKGAESPILKTFSNEESFFYSDGLGDIDEIKDYKADDISVENSNSVLKIIELVETYPKEINLLVIGPPTNIAVASMLYPDVCSRFKNIYMMGGSLISKGNDNVCMGEFNFNFDFIATKIVLSMFKNIILTPWEPTEDVKISSESIEKVKRQIELSSNDYNKHTHKMSELIVNKFTKLKGGVHLCDLYCAMTAFDNKCVSKFSLCKVDTMIDSMANYGMLLFNNRKKYSDDYFSYKEELFKKQFEGSDYHLIIEGLDPTNILEELQFVYRQHS